MLRNGEWFSDLAVNKEIQARDGLSGKQMTELDAFTERMQKLLDKQIWYSPVAYTPHDFSHHVKTVLQYVSAILKDQLAFFSIDDLLVLQYGTILHDMAMIYNPGDRAVHSKAAYSILDVYADEKVRASVRMALDGINSDIEDMADIGSPATDAEQELCSHIYSTLQVLMKHYIPDDGYRRCIGQVILGHSDIKLKNSQISTLRKEFFEEQELGFISDKPVKARILSAVLRLADELDCSYRRKADINDANIPEESKKYWDRLNLIRNVRISPPQIILEVDCNYIKHHDDRQQCFYWLQEIHEKIEEERKTVISCFEDEHFSLNLSQIRVQFRDKHIEEHYQEYCSKKKQESENLTQKD